MVGQWIVLSAARDAAKEALIIADGFRCRAHIVQTADRRARHLTKVPLMTIGADEHRPAGQSPEQDDAEQYPINQGPAVWMVARAGGGLGADGAVVCIARQETQRRGT